MDFISKKSMGTFSVSSANTSKSSSSGRGAENESSDSNSNDNHVEWSDSENDEDDLDKIKQSQQKRFSSWSTSSCVGLDSQTAGADDSAIESHLQKKQSLNLRKSGYNQYLAGIIEAQNDECKTKGQEVQGPLKKDVRVYRLSSGSDSVSVSSSEDGQAEYDEMFSSIENFSNEQNPCKEVLGLGFLDMMDDYDPEIGVLHSESDTDDEGVDRDTNANESTNTMANYVASFGSYSLSSAVESDEENTPLVTPVDNEESSTLPSQQQRTNKKKKTPLSNDKKPNTASGITAKTVIIATFVFVLAVGILAFLLVMLVGGSTYSSTAAGSSADGGASSGQSDLLPQATISELEQDLAVLEQVNQADTIRDDKFETGKKNHNELNKVAKQIISKKACTVLKSDKVKPTEKVVSFQKPITNNPPLEKPLNKNKSFVSKKPNKKSTPAKDPVKPQQSQTELPVQPQSSQLAEQENQENIKKPIITPVQSSGGGFVRGAVFQYSAPQIQQDTNQVQKVKDINEALSKFKQVQQKSKKKEEVLNYLDNASNNDQLLQLYNLHYSATTDQTQKQTKPTIVSKNEIENQPVWQSNSNHKIIAFLNDSKVKQIKSESKNEKCDSSGKTGKQVTEQLLKMCDDDFGEVDVESPPVQDVEEDEPIQQADPYSHLGEPVLEEDTTRIQNFPQYFHQLQHRLSLCENTVTEKKQLQYSQSYSQPQTYLQNDQEYRKDKLGNLQLTDSETNLEEEELNQKKNEINSNTNEDVIVEQHKIINQHLRTYLKGLNTLHQQDKFESPLQQRLKKECHYNKEQMQLCKNKNSEDEKANLDEQSQQQYFSKLKAPVLNCSYGHIDEPRQSEEKDTEYDLSNVNTLIQNCEQQHLKSVVWRVRDDKLGDLSLSDSDSGLEEFINDYKKDEDQLFKTMGFNLNAQQLQQQQESKNKYLSVNRRGRLENQSQSLLESESGQCDTINSSASSMSSSIDENDIAEQNSILSQLLEDLNVQSNEFQSQLKYGLQKEHNDYNKEENMQLFKNEQFNEVSDYKF